MAHFIYDCTVESLFCLSYSITLLVILKLIINIWLLEYYRYCLLNLAICGDLASVISLESFSNKSQTLALSSHGMLAAFVCNCLFCLFTIPSAFFIHMKTKISINVIG